MNIPRVLSILSPSANKFCWMVRKIALEFIDDFDNISESQQQKNWIESNRIEWSRSEWIKSTKMIIQS